METPEQCAKYVQSKQLKHQNNVNEVVLVSSLLTWNRCQYYSSVSIVEFEQINVGWEKGIVFKVNQKVNRNLFGADP